MQGDRFNYSGSCTYSNVSGSAVVEWRILPGREETWEVLTTPKEGFLPTANEVKALVETTEVDKATIDAVENFMREM